MFEASSGSERWRRCRTLTVLRLTLRHSVFVRETLPRAGEEQRHAKESPPTPTVQAAVDRTALSRALVAHGLLTFTHESRPAPMRAARGNAGEWPRAIGLFRMAVADRDLARMGSR